MQRDPYGRKLSVGNVVRLVDSECLARGLYPSCQGIVHHVDSGLVMVLWGHRVHDSADPEKAENLVRERVRADTDY